MKNSFITLAALVVLSLSVVSCGSSVSNVLNNIDVGTQVQGQDVHLDFSADLDLGAMTFASITLPILHPQGQRAIGQLELTSVIGGLNKLSISLNLSEIADVSAVNARLPNGNLIPFIADNQTIALDIGKGALVYLTIGSNSSAIAVALPLKEFDSIGATLPGLNVFPTVNMKGIIGTAGIFTGASSGTSGIAVVADISKVIGAADIFGLGYGVQAEQAMDEVIDFDYRSHSTVKSKKSKLDNLLYKLNLKKTQLSLHQ